MYPERESNPHDQWSKVFKTLASTYFAIWAFRFYTFKKAITIVNSIIKHIIPVISNILIYFCFQSRNIPNIAVNEVIITVIINVLRKITVTLIVFKVNKKVAVSFRR